MITITSADCVNRLALSLMQKYDITYADAMEKLKGLKLRIICGPRIAESAMKQIALLTAVNSGTRAFLGGVNVVLPDLTLRNLTKLQGKGLTEVLANFGPEISTTKAGDFEGFTLFIDLPADDQMSLELVSNSWQGGVVPYGYEIHLSIEEQLPLGAIASAAIGVGAAFFRLTGLDPSCAVKPTGVSLWNPGSDWLTSKGEMVNYLPEKLWVLGLGHLGQAFLWNFVFLPFSELGKVQLMLQDTDTIAEANQSAGLLTRLEDVGIKKTTVANRWLIDFGFKSFITERKFDEHTVRAGSEPYIAVCGFDNASSRRLLEQAGFDLVIEVGLGGQLNNFDDILIHTFPSKNYSAQELWKAADSVAFHSNVLEQFNKLEEKAVCGILPVTIASKAISTSFVGALGGAFAIAEIVKATNCGPRFDFINAQTRNLQYLQGFQEGNYGAEAAQNGSVEVRG